MNCCPFQLEMAAWWHYLIAGKTSRVSAGVLPLGCIICALLLRTGETFADLEYWATLSCILYVLGSLFLSPWKSRVSWMLCHVDFESPEAIFSEVNTCCSRAWASPELSLGAGSSEGWILAWDKSPCWTVVPQLPGVLCVCCAVHGTDMWELTQAGSLREHTVAVTWATLPIPAMCQGIKREGSFRISSPAWKQELMVTEANTFTDHSGIAEACSWQRRSKMSRGRSSIQSIYIHTENSQ